LARANSKKFKDLQRKLDYEQRKTNQPIEVRLAQKLAKSASVHVRRQNNQNEINEKVLVGTADEIRGAVLAEIEVLEIELGHKIVRTEIPDYPQGLVISDSRGEGFFDGVMP
jgi:hypothetical protein